MYNQSFKLISEEVISYLKDLDVLYTPTEYDLSNFMSFLGICATVSVTFLTLLFAIAAINYSFCGEKSDAAYHLKLLIKCDLKNTAVKTIILQLITILILAILSSFITSIDTFFFKIIMLVITIVIIYLLYLMIHALWNTTNSVYYSIVQYNSDYELKNLFEKMDINDNSGIIDIPLTQYDVYTVKKTLYPKLHKRAYKEVSKSKEHLDINTSSKIKLVQSWNKLFENSVNEKIEIIKKAKHNNSNTLIDILNSIGPNKFLTPKIQAPDKVTKICVDWMYRSILSKITYSDSDILDYYQIDNAVLESCLVLLYYCKRYAENRQEERKKHHVRINRARYSNPNDTYMYTLYGNILYYLGRHGDNCEKIQAYYTEAIDAYSCAEIVDFSNEIAKHNKLIVTKELECLIVS